MTPASSAIDELARLPQPELAVIEARIAELKAAGDRLVEAIAGSDAAVAVLAPRLEENQRRLAEARQQLTDARAAAAGPPEPLTADVVRQMLSDLQGLLTEDAAVAAPVLRDLLGEVVISQQVEPGRDKPVWYAALRFDALGAATRFQEGSTRSLADWRRVMVGQNLLASEAERIRLDRLPVTPKPKPIPPYMRIASQAARLREAGLTFAEIGQQLGVHEVTAMRACDHARPGERSPAGRKRPQGGRAQRVRRQVAALLATGLTVPDAAQQAGCSTMTACRAQRDLQTPRDKADAA